MKLAGFLFALYFAQRTFRDVGNDFGSGGSPILMVWGAKATGSDPCLFAAAMAGFGLQALYIWRQTFYFLLGPDLLAAEICAYAVTAVLVVFWFVYIGPTMINNQARLLDGTTQSSQVRFFPREKVQILARLFSSVLAFLAVVSPIVLECLEGICTFLSKSTSASSYILAVLDMVKVIPSLPFAFSFIFHVVPRMWGGAWRGLIEPVSRH